MKLYSACYACIVSCLICFSGASGLQSEELPDAGLSDDRHKYNGLNDTAQDKQVWLSRDQLQLLQVASSGFVGCIAVDLLDQCHAFQFGRCI